MTLEPTYLLYRVDGSSALSLHQRLIDCMFDFNRSGSLYIHLRLSYTLYV